MATATKKPEQELKAIESSKTVKTAEKDIKPFQQFLTKFSNDWSFNLAGALAYNFLLSTFPIILALLAILGFVLGALGQNVTVIENNIAHALPSSLNAGPIIHAIANNLQKSSGILLIFSIVSAIIFGSRLFIVIEGMFCIVYHVRPRKLIPQNLMAIGMLIAFIIYIPVAVLVSSIPTVINTILKNTPVGSFFGGVLGILFGVLVSFGLFLLIYIIVPNQRITFRHSWLGALISGIALELYLILFPLYVRYSLTNTAGAIGATVILIVFFYYFGIILFLGAEVNAYFSERVQPLPNDLATFVSTMAGRLNKDRPDVEAQHINAKPTDNADDAHMGEARRGERRTQRRNSRKQQALASQPIAEEYVEATARAKERASRGPSKTITIFEIVAGSALTLIIEWLRFRRHAR